MALDFPSTSRDSNRNATKDIVHGRNGQTSTVREEGDEECARTLLEFPGRGRHPPLERQNILGMQCGECLLRNEQLRGANRDFLGRRATWPQDRDPGGLCRQRSGSALFTVRGVPPGHL